MKRIIFSLLTVLLCLFIINTTGAEAAGPTECSLIGTWYGDAGYALRWLGVHTAGTTITKGEMLLDWNRVSASLLDVYDLYPGATSLTGGRGVWEQTGRGQYNYTWYAYGIGTPGYSPIYSVRVSGIARNTDMIGEVSVNPCDNIAIDSTYEVFDGFVLPQNMSDAVPVLSIPTGVEQTRVPLTVVPFTPE